MKIYSFIYSIFILFFSQLSLANATSDTNCFTGQLGKLEIKDNGKVSIKTLPNTSGTKGTSTATSYTLATRASSPNGNAMFKLLSLALAARMPVRLKGESGCGSIKSVAVAIQ